MIEPQERARKIAGAVFGAAIGDAMGHPVEFMRVDQIRARFGPEGVQGYELYFPVAGGEGDGRRFAPFTDDTQMAEAVLTSLLAGRAAGDDLDGTMRRMAEAFVEWARAPKGGHRAPGNACLAGCSALAQGRSWFEAGGPDAGGCGSVMRAYPFGLVFADDLERAEAWAVAHSRLTHRAPIAFAACAAMAIGTALSLHGTSPAATLEAMIEAAGRYDAATATMISRAVDEARTGVDPSVTLERLQGWAAHEAIAAAAYIFARHPDDARRAILEGANTSGDSDSIATLAGALVGARVGLDGIPASWVKEIERAEDLAALAAAI